ncbi:MAG: hypothetical protein IPM75_15145 [Candidatus Competibacteraceae bacterium]|nr:hypothetical protein [Candidatus Competibacteraceae bacterium]
MPNSNSDHSRQLRATTARERNSRLVREGHSRFSVMLGPEATAAALAAIQEKPARAKPRAKPRSSPG